MKFQPMNDRILVKRENSEEKTRGGIIIPDSAKEAPAKGLVVAVGPGKSTDEGTRRPLEVKAGETVLFRKYAGTEVNVAGEDQLIMREEEVLAVEV